MSRITRRSIIPVNQITPLTYRDGVTYIQLLTELSDYVKTVLHPSLQHTVDQIVADVEAQIDKAHDQYVDGVQEFQRIHDRFMSDVNASLIALNDSAVSDLVDDSTSLLGSSLRKLFPQWEHLHQSTPISVKEHGAKGDGVTDDSSAIRSAITEAITAFPGDHQNRAIYFPSGTYLIYDDNIFSDYDLEQLGLPSGGMNGLEIRGDGRRSSVLRLMTEGKEKWFYDSDRVRQRLFARTLFTHLRLETDNLYFGNGFKQWSDGGDKQFFFSYCELQLGTVLHTLGTGNADLNRFINCNVHAYTALIILDSVQSVTNGFINTDISLMQHGIIRRGGGTVWITHCNLEMHNSEDINGNTYPGNDGTHYLLLDTHTGNPQSGNSSLNFNEVRMEIQGGARRNKRLIQSVSNDTSDLHIKFNHCQVAVYRDADNPESPAIDIRGNKSVEFNNSLIQQGVTYRATTQATNSMFGAMIRLNNCAIRSSREYWNNFEVSGNGRAIVQGCYGAFSSSGSSMDYVNDFDLGWDATFRDSVGPTVKFARLKNRFMSFPAPGATSGVSAIVPPGYIKRIYVRKDRVTASSASYQVHVGHQEKNTIYASTPVLTANDDFILDAVDVGWHPGGDITLWATGSSATGGGPAGGHIAYVEFI